SRSCRCGGGADRLSSSSRRSSGRVGSTSRSGGGASGRRRSPVCQGGVTDRARSACGGAGGADWGEVVGVRAHSSSGGLVGQVDRLPGGGPSGASRGVGTARRSAPAVRGVPGGAEVG